MTLAYTDILITLVIVGLVLFAAHRLGQVNPVGTGKLARRLSAVELKVAEQGAKIDTLEQTMTTLVESTAETVRVLSAMQIEQAADRGLGERTWSSVSRMENYFIEQAFRTRGDGR